MSHCPISFVVACSDSTGSLVTPRHELWQGVTTAGKGHLCTFAIVLFLCRLPCFCAALYYLFSLLLVTYLVCLVPIPVHLVLLLCLLHLMVWISMYLSLCAWGVTPQASCKAPWGLRLRCEFVHLTDYEMTGWPHLSQFVKKHGRATARSSRSGALRSSRGGRRPRAEVVFDFRG